MALRLDEAKSRRFAGTGGCTEHTISVEIPARGDLARQLQALDGLYREMRQAQRLPAESAVFRRLVISDAANQAAAVRASPLFDNDPDNPVAVSLVQQPPLSGAKIALLAYHVDAPQGLSKQRLSPAHMRVNAGGLDHLWSTRLCAHNAGGRTDAAGQTRMVFAELEGALARNRASLRENCLRTWIYVRDVDIFYAEMVRARSDLFAQNGLTTETHYIASTGIEGLCADRDDLVLMDAYSVLGLAPGQVSYLNDFSRLCATRDYHVTFERGTRVAYADRAHLFISGTASIDAAGEVLHAGDVARQLHRALENVGALLKAGGACLADMAHWIVYLRDPADGPGVRAAMEERFPDIPLLVVKGAVCRPEWLVEVEGIAVVPQRNAQLPQF